MTSPDITALYQTEQLDLLHTDGVFLAKRGWGHKAVLLLQFDSWYVEIHYYRYRLKVKEIIFSKDMTILDPYLEQVDIEEILNLAR